MEGRVVSPGPYRATKLWNEVTKYFRAEMPRRKHRQHFKKYGNCFTATEAIDWLHELLKNNSNFGPEVTRQQTIQLLRKFLKNHVIEDIKGRWGSENLDDNHNLFRFPSVSPVKILPRRYPLSESTDNISKQTEKIFKLPHFSRRTPKKFEFRECKENTENVKSEMMEEDRKNMYIRQITQADIDEVWRNTVVIHLQTILGMPSLNEVLHPAQIVPRYIIYNMTNTSKRGIVLLQDKSEDLPHWVLSAMKCLANWPRSNGTSQPMYMGFERDVFKTVADYFLSLPEPLLTFQYYELFVNILVLCGCIAVPNRSSGKSSARNDLTLSKTPPLNSFKSTECLLLSLLHLKTGEKDKAEASQTVSVKCTAERGHDKKLQHDSAPCEHATVHELAGGSCQDLSRVKNEQAMPLKLKARCYSLEGITDTASSKCSKDGLKTLSETGVHIPFASNGDQLFHSARNPDCFLGLCSDVAGPKQTCGFKRVSASSIPDQELSSVNHKSKQLCRSRSLRGNSSSGWCSAHAPVAEIPVKPHPLGHLGQKTQSTTTLVTKIGNKPGNSDMAISKRLCKSATQLSENTLPPSTLMLTGTKLLQSHLERVAIEALQICCLLLPPSNRRKLQLLMRMITRISENVDMPRLHDAVGTRSLMECLGEELSTIFPTYSYCERITSQEFDAQKIFTSQAAVAELLESIIKDRKLTVKDKKKKLKQFQKEYPEIYRNRFPTTESEAILFEDRPTIKQPMLSLRKPKLRTMRS
ncbi:DEP domain-containing protein 1A isoform X2 [Lacerta agilis]|uniref:DEP domain-containing protein 1A isoform X2 n=1 Tax=Lacerta agilis TaxID=80427 RepID=UPI001419C5FD|nr:DEP domain-containing protein 1A isoform X2 [Lacerta agilis]